MNITEKEFSETLSILTDFEEECRIICAFSGGCDSLCLLILLVRTLGKENVVPVYVNHNLRSEKELLAEVEKNKLNCQKLGLQLVVETIDKGIISDSVKQYGGLEASARHFRYELLEKQRILQNCSYIATAHHYDDQLETVLMKIISNSPITSLRGISEKNGAIIRPLLEFRKSEIENYVRLKGFSWSVDSTNSNNDFKRNEIRNNLIPQLDTVLPDWENRVENIRKKAISLCVGKYDYKDTVEVAYLKSLNRPQQMLVLYSMWDSTISTQMPQTLLYRVIDRLDNTFAKIGANGGMFCIHKGTLYLVKEPDNTYSNFRPLNLELNGVTHLPDGNYIEATLSGKSKDIRLDPTLFSGKPVVRFAQIGDTIKLKDGSKKVMRLLQDLKVPPVLRNKVPVISDDEGICAVFASAFGANDRICVKMRSSLAEDCLYSYIYKKGK